MVVLGPDRRVRAARAAEPGVGHVRRSPKHVVVDHHPRPAEHADPVAVPSLPDVVVEVNVGVLDPRLTLLVVDEAVTVQSSRNLPWRAVAARVLWAYYHVAKDREGIR